MVCTACLNAFHGGGEKSCAHGWDLLANGSRGCFVYPYEVAYVTRERLLNRMAE